LRYFVATATLISARWPAAVKSLSVVLPLLAHLMIC